MSDLSKQLFGFSFLPSGASGAGLLSASGAAAQSNANHDGQAPATEGTPATEAASPLAATIRKALGIEPSTSEEG